MQIAMKLVRRPRNGRNGTYTQGIV